MRHIKIIFTDDKGKKIKILNEDLPNGSTWQIEYDVQPHYEGSGYAPRFLYYTGKKQFTLHIPEDPGALGREMTKHRRKLKKP